jgi:hypothetical protein
MTQQSRNENARVVCLFCGTSTFVPASLSRYSASEADSGTGVTLVRCHVCRKEAPYSASEIFLTSEVPLAGGNSRSRSAAL